MQWVKQIAITTSDIRQNVVQSALGHTNLRDLSRRYGLAAEYPGHHPENRRE